MKIIKLFVAVAIVSVSISCNSQKQETAEFFVKYKANNIPYKILFLKPDESGYDHPSDTTTSIRKFEELKDSIVLDDGSAYFHFHFYKHGDASNYKDINLTIEKNFTLTPKDYKIADFDLDKQKTLEERNNGDDGLASFDTSKGALYSWQYSWVKNHRPAKWTITKVDEAAKTIAGTFSFTTTQTESDGSTDISKRNTFLKIIEIDLTEGEFHLPYTIVKH